MTIVTLRRKPANRGDPGTSPFMQHFPGDLHHLKVLSTEAGKKSFEFSFFLAIFVSFKI